MDTTTRVIMAPDKIRTRDRSFIAEWVVEVEGGAETVMQLSVDHFQRSKSLSASVRQIIRSREAGFLVEKFSPFTDPVVRLGTKPVARYSEKAAEDFFNEVLGAVYTTTDPTLLAMYAGTVVDKF